jgi:hypothetical protein
VTGENDLRVARALDGIFAALRTLNDEAVRDRGQPGHILVCRVERYQ